MPDDLLAPSSGPGDRRPVPDPSTLTTAALYREIGQLRELLTAGIDGDNKHTAERFAGVDQQFQLIERTRVELRIADQTALAAALAAQKESSREQADAFERATAKAEAAVTKQLEQLTINSATAATGQAAIINDLKERIGRAENIRVGMQERRADTRAQITTANAVLGLVIAVITIVGLIVAANAFSGTP